MTRFTLLRRCGAVALVEKKFTARRARLPTEIPALRPEMTEVAKEDWGTRYHVSFQTEADDRGTAWLLVLVLLPGGHGYPGVARRLTFAWFDRWLGRKLE